MAGPVFWRDGTYKAGCGFSDCPRLRYPAILRVESMNTRFQGLARWLVTFGLFMALGCGSSLPLANQATAGVVTSRAEGYSDRPAWADPNQALQQNGQQLIVVGYVSIHPEQRLEMGYRAADSYARAELLRFLTTRVVAVLEDQQTSSGAQSLRETVEDSASASVDNWTVAAHYWEKRKVSGQERLHVYSRLEVDQSSVAELLQRAISGSTDLKSKSAEYQARLNAKWSQLVQSAKHTADEEDLPPGVEPPPWARQGDVENDEGFTFVCHGSANDENKAKALAAARCNEKLCRIFGVQITAKTRVKEDLQGITAESEVTEQCDSVRVVGRQTTNRGGDCGSAGCNFWIRQTYSRSAFAAERQRLEQPTVIQQQVVIQEGDKVYRDPKACDGALRNYSAVDGLTAAAYQARRKFLMSALKTCQGIDGRDSGLFMALNTLLLDPLPKFVAVRGTRSAVDEWRARYVLVTADWRKNIETQRFLTDRVQTVLRVVNDAILPMRVIDLMDREGGKTNPPAEREVDDVVRELIAYPFGDEPAKPSHAANPHSEMVHNTPSRGVPFSSRYRDFLLGKLEQGKVMCSGSRGVSGDAVAGYLESDGQLDSREWKALLNMLTREPLDGLYTCFGNLLQDKMDSALRSQRIHEVLDLIVDGRIRRKPAKNDVSTSENVGLAKEWIFQLRPEEQWPLYLQYRPRLVGSESKRRDLTKDLMRRQFGKSKTSAYFNYNSEARDTDLPTCEAQAPQLAQVLAQVPDASVEDSMVCPCLALSNLSQVARSSLVQIWLKGSSNRCKFFKKEEWPGGYYVWPYPTRRWGSDAPNKPFRQLSDVLKKEAKACEYDAAGIRGLSFTPTLRGVLKSGLITQVRVTVDLDGELDRFSFRDSSTRWVTKSDVEAAKGRFLACFTKAAEGY